MLIFVRKSGLSNGRKASLGTAVIRDRVESIIVVDLLLIAAPHYFHQFLSLHFIHLVVPVELLADLEYGTERSGYLAIHYSNGDVTLHVELMNPSQFAAAFVAISYDNNPSRLDPNQLSVLVFTNVD